MFIPHFQCKKWFLVQSLRSLRLMDQKLGIWAWQKKNPKHQFLPPFIIAFISQVKAFKLLIFWHQDLWGISANVNNIFGLLIAHSFTNSTFIDNSSQSHHKIHDLYNRTNKTENLIDGLFQLCMATLYFSMTSLFAHKVAQLTKWRFLSKNLNQLVIYVIGLAFTWSWVDQK